MTEAAMSSTAPAKASLAAETTPATATPVKRLVPTAITLLLRDDGTLALRAESPDAVDGFYNVDRDENSPQARWRMRRRGQELARQHGVKAPHLQRGLALVERRGAERRDRIPLCGRPPLSAS